MGKNKLRKFAEMEANPLVLQYPFSTLRAEGFPLRGRWGADFFHNDNPIVLELGCGKGEYTLGLAQRNPGCNYIGIDIKGARMHTGASAAIARGLRNVAFLRTSIELLDNFFMPGEVSEIWITFPDPQMKKASKRLTGTRFMELYRKVLIPDGFVRLKSDSPFLYAYTGMMLRHNGLPVEADCADLHAGEEYSPEHPLRSIRTHYEQQWLDRGLSIKYLSWRLPAQGSLEEPPEADTIEADTYRSYSRGYIQMPQMMNTTKADK